MVTRTALPDPAAVRRAIEDVPDPELPPVTIGMLGMIHAVSIEGTRVHVELLPTFSGCPATDMIERDVVAAAGEVEGVEEVRVRFRYDPPWSAARIDARGRERLREFGIAPPGAEVEGSARPDGRPTLPLATLSPSRPCPYCGSLDTTRESSFGPTPCRDIRFCATCQHPFEAFKSL